MTRRTSAAALCFTTAMAALAAVAPGPAFAGNAVTIAYANTSFAAVCDLTQPLAFIGLTATNASPLASTPITLTGSETIAKLGGSAAIPGLAPHASFAVSLPLRRLGATDPGTLAGLHHIIITTGATSLSVDLPFPAGLCKSATPAPGPTPKPGINTTGSTSARSPVRPIVLTLAAPANVRSVSAGTDCGTHVGPIGALVCPDMMKSGNMLLIWDWAPGAAGLDAITGYRVYRVGRGIGYERNPDTLIGTVNNKGQTLFDVPKPAGGVAYDGMCFTVTAFAGAKESAHSSQYCAASTSAAKTATFTPIREASMTRSTMNGKVYPADNVTAKFGWREVGFHYWSQKNITGDQTLTDISRYAMLFDVSKLVGRKLVEAHLTVNVLQSSDSRPDCTNSVGWGTEEWWNGNRWPEGTFGTPSLTLLGGQLRVDATNLVSLWIVGRPNLGIILRNDDENLGAFTNKSCQTFYAGPVLTITYY
jgi:hypothetical protein